MRFDVILADPPWFYSNRVQHGEGPATKFGGGASGEYPLMCDADIIALGDLVKAVSAEQSVLFLWGTFPRFPLALEVMESWGFHYSTVAFQWIKVNSKNGEPFRGPGKISSSNAEPLLVGWRGKSLLPVVGAMQSQIVEWPFETEDIWEPHPRWPVDTPPDPVSGKRRASKIIHSAKPGVFHERIAGVFGPVSRLELFAREHPGNWGTAIGNEITGNDIREDLEALALL